VHVVAAPDKFRGSLSASAAARAIASAAEAAGWTCREVPLADGGEGTLDAFGGPNRVTTVTGPLGNPVDAGWRLDGEQAVVEMARASGLALAGGKEANDPLGASTRGTGELIASAVAAGARHVVVGVGGSATTDGGLGAVDVLRDLAPFSSRRVTVRVACDVQTSFVDAARVFAPQKGADVEQVALLANRLRRLARRYRDEFGIDVERLPGAGAAGGLGGGLAALGAELVPGFELVADSVGLDRALAAADLVVTGEGLLDATSFAGKVVDGVTRRAAAFDVPVLVVAGDVATEVADRVSSVSLIARFGEERAWSAPEECIAEAVAVFLQAR
jgi:glycerate kinase